MDIKRLFVGFVMIAAVAVAGCSSDGDGARIAELEDMLAAVEGERDTANQTVTDLQGQLDTATDNATDLQGDLDDAKQEVERLTGELDTANQNVMDLQERIAMLTEPNPNALAQAKAMAIILPDRTGAPGTIDDKRRPGRPKAGNDAVMVGADVTVDGDKLGVSDKAIKDDEEFAMQSESPASLQDFDGSIHTRSIKTGVTDKLHVYTDKEGPSDKNYLDYFADRSMDGPADTLRPAVVAMLDDDESGDNEKGKVDGDNDGRLTFVNNATAGTPANIAATERSLFNSGGFPSGNNRFIDYEDDPDTSSVDERKFTGTFSGISGTFTCTTATCRAENDGNGMLAKLEGTWTFTPDGLQDDTKVRGVIPDQDYLSFGFWLQETVKDGETTYGVSTFYGGKDVYDVSGSNGQGAMSQLVGSATYKGDATGLFVKKTFTVGEDGAVVGTPTSAGQFTAYAELAKFGGAEYGTASDFEILGTVSHFRHDGQMIDENWEVKLEDAGFADDKSSNHMATFSGSTSTGPGSTPGEWNGGFFGNPGADDPAGVVDTTDDYPTIVAGEFTGHFENGNVIGAFGATR